MVKRRIMAIALVCMLLAASLSGCGCQAEEPVETTLATATTPETTSTQGETAESAAETTEAATAPTISVETTQPTEDDFWECEPTEDTRPPIEVTVPEETIPYTDYERYNDMTAEEQEKYFNSFESPEAFFDWYNKAKSEYEDSHPDIIIDGSTNIEIKP